MLALTGQWSVPALPSCSDVEGKLLCLFTFVRILRARHGACSVKMLHDLASPTGQSCLEMEHWCKHGFVAAHLKPSPSLRLSASLSSYQHLCMHSENMMSAKHTWQEFKHSSDGCQEGERAKPSAARITKNGGSAPAAKREGQIIKHIKKCDVQKTCVQKFPATFNAAMTTWLTQRMIM